MPSDPQDARIPRLYEAMAPSLFRYSVVVLANPHEAEDVVQQVFAALAKRDLAAIASLEHYVRRAVRNECYRSLGRRRDDAVHPNGLPLLEVAPGVDDRPDERLGLDQGLRSLPPEQREVVHLKAFEGLTFQEIADHTGESINTVASRYRYAIEKLRAVLGSTRHP